MIINLIPLSHTAVNWKDYLQVASDALGRSPTAGRDAQWKKHAESLSVYLDTLNEISPDGAALEHVHISFILVAPQQATYAIIIKSKLSATTAVTKHNDFNLSILSGTLSEWRSTILDCCTDKVSIDIRQFGAAALAYIDQLNLSQFMTGIVRVPMGDGTIRLIDKGK